MRKCVIRRTRGGRIAVFGPAEVVQPGQVVTVDVEVKSVGQPFEVDGEMCVYGYLTERKSRPAEEAEPF